MIDLEKQIADFRGILWWSYLPDQWFIGPVHPWIHINFPSWEAYYLGELFNIAARAGQGSQSIRKRVAAQTGSEPKP